MTVEEIKAEVIRLREEFSRLEDAAIRQEDDEYIGFYQGKRKACEQILKFIEKEDKL